MAAGQVTQPVRVAGGAAAIPLTTVVYAATSLTFPRAALTAVMAAVRNLAIGVLAEQDRSMPPRSGSTAATPTDPWRPSVQARIKRTSRKNARAPGPTEARGYPYSRRTIGGY